MATAVLSLVADVWVKIEVAETVEKLNRR